MDKQTESRDKFEKWFSDFAGHTLAWVKSKRNNGDGYVSGVGVQAHWMTWTASRESLVVELPERQAIYASGYGDGYMVPSPSGEALEYDETVDSLRAIGIRIKGEGDES